MKWPDHPELVRLYDVECAARHDYDYYLDLVAVESDTCPTLDIADVGCGTGVFAIDVSERGHRITGLDPSPTIIERARTKSGGDTVDWRIGTAADLPPGAFDLIVMMGHVAQYFVSDTDWSDTLAACYQALRPGGLLAFETRDPTARAWERWTESETRASYPHPDGGIFESWVEVVDVRETAAGHVVETHEGHTLLDDGTHLVSAETLIFRDLAAIEDSLSSIGFKIERVDRDWDGRQTTEPAAELIVRARRPALA